MSLALIFLTVISAPVNAEPTKAETYRKIYLKMSEAETFSKKGDNIGALRFFQDCQAHLIQLRQRDPDWEGALVEVRLKDASYMISQLQGKIQQEASPDQVTNTTPTTSPVTLSSSSPPPRKKDSHPWKTNIVTSKFWIAEASTTAWGLEGKKTNADTPLTTSFYVALPFNDLTHPEEARKWVPASWKRSPKNGKPVSWCKGRWVQIKNAKGLSCYAQWEDVGPNWSDAGAYVFGHEGVPTPGKAGLDVSPAVAEYLGLHGEAITSWRFVDEEDVRPGMWLRMKEKNLLDRPLDPRTASSGNSSLRKEWSTGEMPANPAKTP